MWIEIFGSHLGAWLSESNRNVEIRADGGL